MQLRLLRRNSVQTALGVAVLSLVSAGCHRHYVLHPKHPVTGVEEWSEQAERDGLEMRFAWARPLGSGPFATILVHPEAWSDAKDMRGILRSLALEGYLAVAVDYRREPTPERPKSTFFVWQGPEDASAAVDHVLTQPEVDSDRLAAIGYSQGAMYSLLIAAYTGKVSTVVAYYPIADIEAWLHDDEGRNWATRQAFKFVRRTFRKRSGAESLEEYRGMLRAGSPVHHAATIDVPVLLVHGDADKRVNVKESRRIAQALRDRSRDVELVEIDGGKHVFNFKNAEQAQEAWLLTLAWLEENLPPPLPQSVSSRQRY